MDREGDGGSVINHAPSSGGGGNGDTIVHMKNELACSLSGAGGDAQDFELVKLTHGLPHGDFSMRSDNKSCL